MGNEMGNNNTSGLKDEENTTVENCKTSLVDNTHENGTIEEHQLVPEVEGKYFHEKIAKLASDDPKRIGDPCVENQTSSIEEHQNAEVHPLGETPKVTMESAEAEERDIKLQPDTSVNNPGLEKPIERNMEESELQGTMQYQLEKHDSFKKDEEDGTISTSDGLEPKESMPVEACKASLLDSTREIDRNEESQIGAEYEGNDFYEKVAYSATDDRNMIEDLCIDNLTSSTKDLEEDEEDGIISRSDDLEPKENVTAEACQTSLLDSTPKNDTNEENEIVAEVEEKGLHEKVAYSATDDREMIEDPCIENQTSRTKEQEDSEVSPLGEFPQYTMESTEVREEDGKVQPVMLSSDSGHKEPIEQNNKEYVIQAGTMRYQLDKQDCLKKDDEEDGTISAPQDLEAKEYKSFESNQQELVSIPADHESVEFGSGLLLGSKDCLRTSSTSDFEAYGHVLDTETIKGTELSADSSSDPALQAKGDALSLKQKASEELLKSSENQSETKDVEKVETGFSNKTLTSSYDHVGLEYKCNVDHPTEVNLIDNPKAEPEALLLSSSHLEVPEPKDKCIVLEEEIRLPGKVLENGDKKHCTNQIQPCLPLRMESEPDCDKSSEAKMVEPTHEKSETVSMINPLRNKVCQTEEPKFVEGGNLVLRHLNDQHEATEDQCYQESERKLEVVPELGIISPELTIQHLSHKEEESVANRTVQERGDRTELAIEMEETERTEQDCLPPEENTVNGKETVPSINDSITELKKDNSGDFLATENPTIDFTSWIAEALVSMNNLEAEMLGQQVTQQNEAHQAEVAASEESKTFAEVETSPVSVSSGSETQETVGRSSTVSTESDPDNLNIVHAQIQKSPSFSLDLKSEARAEESDSTPLLFQDKAEIESLPSQGEKVITLERSESEESETPFLGFLKKEEENNVVEKHIRENHSPAENSMKILGGSLSKKATTTSPKGKEKRRHRPSLFSNCLCCATVIN
uniref:uncharacterized protein LOC105350986 isoform X2 n=1 Tax=Fragaria vesca subsp. vesca TaxID=101020 RepID=UPI0005C7E9FA|nr:PREDICTED: uncharacterized protein LOC105350986 isoform X2 [Fragaria vesca subsp. vesca]